MYIGAKVDVLGHIGYIIGACLCTHTEDDRDKILYLVELETPILTDNMTIGVITAIRENISVLPLEN